MTPPLTVCDSCGVATRTGHRVALVIDARLTLEAKLCTECLEPIVEALRDARMGKVRT